MRNMHTGIGAGRERGNGRWRFHVNIRFGVALNIAEGASNARAVAHTALVVLLAIAAGCTGFVSSVAVLSLTWLVPAIRKGPPVITEKPHRRIPPAQLRAPSRSSRTHKKTESLPRPEPVRHVSFHEQVSIVPSAPASAPSSPRGRSIPLPRCKNRTVQSKAVSFPPVAAPITPDNSPLSSAETLTETPAEVKRAFSSRITRVLLHPRGRELTRSSTIASTAASSSSATVVSDFGELAIVPGKGETRSTSDHKQPSAPERGMFGFLKKSKTIDVQIGRDESTSRTRPPPLSLPSPAFTSNLISSADSTPSRLTDSPGPVSPPHLPVRSEQSQHRRILSTPTTSSKLRIAADRICSRKEKDKGLEPKPARTQPYGPPYNWIPPAPGTWAVIEDADEPVASEKRRKRASAPPVTLSSHDGSRHRYERFGGILAYTAPYLWKLITSCCVVFVVIGFILIFRDHNVSLLTARKPGPYIAAPADVAVTANIAELGDVGDLNKGGESLQSKLVVMQCLSYGYCYEAREDMRVGSGGEKDPEERKTQIREWRERGKEKTRREREANGRIDKREQEKVEATKVDKTRNRKDRRGKEG
ncbi:hypothetical protein BC826DRAFT_1178256 [Russula brevipes]|nr:hypothetical protein BC826DRAFT_1178256 [Russula brevipes]